MLNFLKRMTQNNEETKNDTIVNDGANPGDVTVTEENKNETTQNEGEQATTNTNETTENEGDEVAEADNSVAKYRMLHPTDRKDASGTMQTVPAGAIVELPVVYGDSLVAQGQAELVETEEVVE